MGTRFVYERKIYYVEEDTGIVRIEDEHGPVVEIITEGDSSYGVEVDEKRIERVSVAMMNSPIAYAHEVKAGHQE